MLKMYNFIVFSAQQIYFPSLYAPAVAHFITWIIITTSMDK